MLAATPSVWPEFESGARRYVLRRYPFSIVYRVAGELIEVIAVAHQRRKPYYWRDR